MKPITLLLSVCAVLVTCPSGASAQFSFDAYADFWAAVSATRPVDGKRAWSTQPWRTNTMSVNLVTVGIRYADSTMRGRIALQEGTFPQVNYVDADAAWRMIGEASIGLDLGNDIWLDAGILPSHIGFESARPSANITLTRSLIADYTPYYEAGVKLSHTTQDGMLLAVLLLQGWQQIVDVNDDPAVGTMLSIPISSTVSVQWNTFLGNEALRGEPTSMRAHSNLTIQGTISEFISLAVLFDATVQRLPAAERAVMLYGGLQVRHIISDKLRAAYRAELASDPDGVLFRTPFASGFQTASGSVNVDYALTNHVEWRTEVRAFTSNNAVFPSRSGDVSTDVLFTTALAVTF